MAEKGRTQINLKISEDVEAGQPVNFFQMGHSPYEFYLDMGVSVPGVQGGFKVLFRGFMPPERVKELHNIIGAQIEQYEKNFQEIKLIEPKEMPQKKSSDISTSYIG